MSQCLLEIQIVNDKRLLLEVREKIVEKKESEHKLNGRSTRIESGKKIAKTVENTRPISIRLRTPC